MTNSGLIVFLPLVAAFVGAIIGAWANSWYRDREANKAQDQERCALLLLIDAEVVSHMRGIVNAMDIQKAPVEGQRPVVPGVVTDFMMLSTEDWDRIKVRLAQLLPADDMTALLLYYESVKDIAVIASHDETKTYTTTIFAELGKGLLPRALAIRERSKKYLKALPDYNAGYFDLDHPED